MKQTSDYYRPRLLSGHCILLAVSALLAGCRGSDERVSSDLDFIRNQIDLNIPAPAGKWEIYETPENSRLAVPGPTDYVTLVAEFENVASSWAAMRPVSIDQAWVAPDVSRPWLADRWKALLQRAQSGKIEFTAADNCHQYSARVRKSGRVVKGFTCTSGDTVLLYLNLAQP